MRLLLVSLMATSSLAVTTTSELNWSTHYGKAKLQATVAQRPLVVVIEDPKSKATRLDDEVLRSATFEKINGYQLCRVDASTPYGERVAEAFGVKELPFTAITDSQVKQIQFRKVGQMTSDQWTRALDNPPTRTTVYRVETPSYSAPSYSAPSYSAPVGFGSGPVCRT